MSSVRPAAFDNVASAPWSALPGVFRRADPGRGLSPWSHAGRFAFEPAAHMMVKVPCPAMPGGSGTRVDAAPATLLHGRAAAGPAAAWPQWSALNSPPAGTAAIPAPRDRRPGARARYSPKPSIPWRRTGFPAGHIREEGLVVSAGLLAAVTWPAANRLAVGATPVPVASASADARMQEARRTLLRWNSSLAHGEPLQLSSARCVGSMGQA
jgi:hypothetical protein